MVWVTLIAMSQEAATPKPPVANEGLKAASRHLRGTIAEDLADTSTGTISDDNGQLTKFHGMYMQDDRDVRNVLKKEGKEKAFAFMVRLRLPGGRATPQQWLVLDRLAGEMTSGSLRITTRQTFQFHGVLKGNVKKLVQEMHSVLVDSISACGDVNRNVVAPPNPERSPVLQQVYEQAKAWSVYAMPKSRAYHEIYLDEELVAGGEPEIEPMYGPTYLPRKFKTGFALPPTNDVDIYAQDLGFIAFADGDRLAGYDVVVGGGQGMSHGNAKTYPRLASLLGFINPESVIPVAEAVLTTQRDFGDRTDRKHARLKYTIDDRGLDWFKAEVESRSGVKFGPARAVEFTTIEDPHGWHACDDGTWFYGLHILSGRIKDLPGWPMKTALREIAEIHTGDFRLTTWQNVTISGVTAEQKPRIDAILQRHGLTEENDRSRLRLNALSCVALPTCGLALAESERRAARGPGKARAGARGGGARRGRHQPAHHRLPEWLRPALPGGDRFCRQSAEQVRALSRRQIQRDAHESPRCAQSHDRRSRGALGTDHQELRRGARGGGGFRRLLRSGGSASGCDAP